MCSGGGPGPADCARGASCAAKGSSEAAGSLSARTLYSEAATERSETELMERRRLLLGCSWWEAATERSDRLLTEGRGLLLGCCW